MARGVLITGISSGIGRAAAELFHGQGWNVVGTVRDPARLQELTRERLTLVPMELTDPASIRAGVEAAIEEAGAIDVLVNNAGFHVFGFFEEATEALLREQIETNLMGPIHAIRAILPHMRARRSGTIVNVTSLAGLTGPPLNSYYAASKFGLEGLSESLAAELKPFGIRCRIVEPGSTATNIFTKWDSHESVGLADYDAIRDRIVGAISPDPSRGFPPEMIAKVILEAAVDEGERMRYPASPDVQAVFELRNRLGSEGFVAAMRERFPT